MPDGKKWTTANLNVDTDGSYCYEDAELNCRRYGPPGSARALLDDIGERRDYRMVL
jgi:uncharacterized protein (TIGR02145 family)